MKLSKSQIGTLRIAIRYAIRDQQEFIAAWTPEFRKPSPDAKKIIRETAALIKKMQRLDAKAIAALRDAN